MTTQPAASRLAYMIASAPGAGSEYLCACLGSTGVLGRPDAYFQPEAKMIAIAARLGASSFSDYLDRLVPNRPTPNGAFGFAVEHGHLRYLEMVNGLARIGRRVGAIESGLAILWIERQDVVAQAAAFARQRLIQTRGPEGVAYNFKALTAALSDIAEQKKGWGEYLTQRKLKPIGITYDALVADPAGVLKRLIKALGVTADPGLARAIPGVPQQVLDEENAWAQQFRAEAAERGLTLPAAAA